MLDCLAFNHPTAYAVAERRDRSRRAQQDGILLHLSEKLGPDHVALNPGIEQRFASMSEFGRRPFHKLFQDWTKICFPIFEHPAQEHAASDDEIFPPQLPGCFESFRLKAVHLKSSAPQGFCSSADRRVSFLCDRRAAVVFAVSNSEVLNFIA